VTEALAGAETVLSTCLGLRAEESVLIVYDGTRKEDARTLFRAAADAGAERPMMVHFSGERSLAAPMLEHDVTLFCVSDILTLALGHSDSRLAACRAGHRVAFLTQPLSVVPTAQEIETVAKKTRVLRDMLEGAHTLVVKTESGTELAAQVSGREPIAVTSIIRSPGSWGAVPDYAEVALAPLERSANGRVFIDGGVIGLGLPEQPFTLDCSNGLVSVSCGKGRVVEQLSSALASDAGSAVLCELGFGTNHIRREIKGEFDDKKLLGSFHIGVGDNHAIGGVNRSSVHLDCLSRSCELLVDSRTIEFEKI
jgi:leucyl aminopeptidase (aminopeptidase T)